MKRFEFKLQTLLSFRKHLERVAQQDMAKTVMEVSACETQIDLLQTTHGQSARKLESIVEKGVAAQEFKQHYDYLGAVTQMIAEEQQRKIQLAKILQKKRVVLKKRSVDKIKCNR